MIKRMMAEKMRTFLRDEIDSMNRSELVALVAYWQLWAKLRGRESSDSGGVRRQ